MANLDRNSGPKVVTGKRARGGSPLTGRMFTVLVASLALAVLAGAILLSYYR